MIQINPLKSYIDGGVRAALTTPPSASLVFDLPGKAIWVKGVKLKGTDHTYTFNHDNYITLTNTPDKNNPESEDIKIGVNITTLKNVIDTTYNGGTLALLQEGLNTEERTWQAKILHSYINDVLPTTKNLQINGTKYAIYTTANSLPQFFAPTSLGTTGQILACTSSGLSWIDQIQNTDYRVSQSSTTSNSDYRIILKQGANNNPETDFVRFSEYLTFNPYTKTLKINNIKVVTATDIYVGSTAGLVPTATSAQQNYYLRGDGSWVNIATEMAAANTWRPIKVGNTDALGSGTNTGTLSFIAGTGITLAWDATNKRIIITNSSPDINHNTDRTGIKLATVSGTKKTDSTLILANSTTGLNIQGGTNKFLIGDGTNYIEVPVVPSVSNKNAAIGTTLTTIATVAGVDIKAKIASYSLSNHTHSVKINGSTKTIAASGGTAVDLGSYLPLSGGTMILGEGLKFHSDDNYFGTNSDARIISLLDGNDVICDGGLIIDERATLNGIEYVTELLRIRDSEFKWRGQNILHTGNSDVSGGGSTWGSSITVKINGTSKTLTIPGNPNTDENVRQVPKTDNVNRPLMMINGSTSAGEQINTSMFSTGIYANASTKMITANGFIKVGSSNNYVLLGGGDHKALSDFSMSGHNHDGRYLRWNGSAADISAMGWGTLTTANGYTILSHASSSDGGDVGFTSKNGQIFMQLDGYYYQNEGRCRVLDTSDFTAFSNVGSQITRITIGGITKDLKIDADTLDGYHYNQLPYIQRLNWWDENTSHNANDLLSGTTFAYSTHSNCPTTGTIVAFNCINLTGYPLQLQGKYYGEELWFRNRNGDNGTWQTWRYVIHNGNIGTQSVNYANSAGNADTVDGYHASAFAAASHTHSYLPLSGGTMIGDINLHDEVAVIWSPIFSGYMRMPFRIEDNGYFTGINLYNSNHNVFTKIGIFTNKYGQGNDINSIFLYPNAAPKIGTNIIWHAGNDGSGSGLDADMTDGLHIHSGRNNEANKIVRTDANGYIQAGWINTLSGDMGTTAATRIYCSDDGYIRYKTISNFRTDLVSGLYWANIKVSTSSSITTTPTFGQLYIKYGTDRARTYIISERDEPCDLFLGTQNNNDWSITSRSSNENNELHFYAARTSKHVFSVNQYANFKFGLESTAKVTVNGDIYTNTHLAVGTDLSTYERGRAELDIVSQNNVPCDLWLGSNKKRIWYFSCRSSSDDNYMLIIGRGGDSTGSSYISLNSDVNAYNYYASSDIRLKNNINNISKSIRSFTWKNSGQKSYGLIAQEIENEYPELVSNNNNGYKSINYTSALCMLVAKLENGLDKLKEKVKQLEDKLRKYENTL